MNNRINRNIGKTGRGTGSKRRLIRKLCLSASAFVLIATGPGTRTLFELNWHVPKAYAALPDGADPFGDLEALPDRELDRQRGGFMVGNMEVSVGVSVSTTIDGFVEVVSTFSINQPGELVSVGQTVQSVPAVDIPPVPEVEIAEVNIPPVPEVEIPEVEIPEVEVAEVNIPPVQLANDVPSAEGTVRLIDDVIKESTDLALDAAKEVFNSMEFKDKAKVTHNGVKAPTGVTQPSNPENSDNQPVDIAVQEINNGLDTAKNTINDTLSTKTTSSSGKVEGNHQATPDTGTLTAADAGTSGKAASPIQPPSATADVVVSGPAFVKDTVETSVSAINNGVKIIHQTKDGHISIIRNSLNGISIRQNVSVDLTLENFNQVRSMSRVQRNLSSIARQMGILSLRR